jgi:amino acid adenylation domain-containing protein
MKQRSTETNRSDVIRRIANLPPEKRTLLEQKLKVAGFASFVKQVICRRASGESGPLSFAQQRLWFLDQYEPNSSVYNVESALRLRGSLDVAALERSLNEIVRRHEALRTTFSVVGGVPVQVIAPPLAVSLSIEGLTGCPEEEREERARDRVREETRRPFDLIKGPLFRSTLLKLGDEDHILLLTMHHVVSDGWSMGVLQRELSVLYRAFMKGQSSPLGDLPIQYADYAVWQREWLQGDVLEKQLSYWKEQLEGVPAVLNLPTDRPRPAVQSFRGRRQSIELSKDLTQGLKTLSRKEGVTLFMTLLAAFQTLLYRYTGKEDIVVGSPIVNRNRTEIEGLIGFFVNTLVLRSDLSGNPTFREVLGRVRKTALQAYDHQDFPFEKLVEELQPKRSLSHSPLFQVMFVLQNTPPSAIKLGSLRVNPVRMAGETAKFDLTLSLREEAGELKGTLQYSADLFDETTITRMSAHFRTLLEGIVAKPDQLILDLPMLTEAERHQLLIEWNDTKRDYPADKCIQELFEEQVERSPDAVAVIFEDQQLTYRELNTRANQLAHYLRKQGVSPEVLIGICVERSLEMVVGVLGILKAGGAYVFLDPEYPEERLAFILEDAAISVLVTQLKLLPQFSSLKARVICIDKNCEKIAQESDDNPNNLAAAGNLAYVIYTSGSAGQPKGVQIQHSSVVNVLSSMRRRPGLTSRDTVLSATTLSFDIAGLELYLPLTVGGQTIVVTREVASDGGRLANRLSGATVMQATPSSWAMLLDNRWEGGSQLKILCGGEALPKKLADQLLCRSSSLWNMYGPTETTIWSAHCQVSANGESVPLGRPIDNTQTYILDAHLQPVAIGVPGEIYISGDGLARGYLKQPDLTAEKFLPNPFSKQAGTRLYKTGDIARYLRDGNIEFVGRIDNQVKIRGFRIELGEIESVLSQHLSVREVVVLAREDNPGDKRLVAYVVPNKEQPCTISEMRNFLKQKLPAYMVPSALVLLETMPLTSNRKVDCRALPVPDRSRSELEKAFVAPRTPVEQTLADIWREVLKLERVGIHDNFFDLGGHSLKATQVVSRVCEALQANVPLRALFEAPTIEELANMIMEKRVARASEEDVSSTLTELESLSDEEAQRLLASHNKAI